MGVMIVLSSRTRSSAILMSWVVSGICTQPFGQVSFSVRCSFIVCALDRRFGQVSRKGLSNTVEEVLFLFLCIHCWIGRYAIGQRQGSFAERLSGSLWQASSSSAGRWRFVDRVFSRENVFTQFGQDTQILLEVHQLWAVARHFASNAIQQTCPTRRAPASSLQTTNTMLHHCHDVEDSAKFGLPGSELLRDILDPHQNVPGTMKRDSSTRSGY